MHGDQPGIARAGADQIDGRILHGCSLVSRRHLLGLGENRIRTASQQRSATRMPTALGSRIGACRAGARPRGCRPARSRSPPASSSRPRPSRTRRSASGTRRPAASTTARSAVERHAAVASSIVSTSSRVRAIVLANFDRDDALTRRRHADVGRQRRRNAMCVLQPAQAGRGQDQRIIVARVELAQPRVEIAADRLEPGAGKQRVELRDAPDAAGPDSRRAARGARLTVVNTRCRAARSAGRPRRADPHGAAPRRASSPAGSTAGRSLLLCTARSISPASRRPRFP